MLSLEDAHRARTGRMVRELRATRGMSVRALAGLLGVSPGTVSAIEHGRTRLSADRVRALADVLEVPVAVIVGDRSSMGYAVPSPPQAPATGWRQFAPLDVDPVLAAAIRAFVETGYHGATMRRIAELAGMSVPGVYHHHASKQEILVAAFDLTMGELRWRLDAARAEAAAPLERLALLVEALALFHARRRELAFLGASEMRSLEPASRVRIAALRADVQHLLDAEIALCLRRGLVRSVHPRDAGRAISTMCTSLCQWYDPLGPTTPEQIAREYAQFALGMLGAVR